MFIHQAVCISPQQTFQQSLRETFVLSIDNKLQVIEPKYEGIPLNVMRRMGKAVRMGVGACLPIIKQHHVDGIIIGTANGGMDDCIKFLNQVIEFDEGTLTPTNFVQSTSNAIAAQVAFLSQNNQYNITHVHRGLAFENALLDAWMYLKEHPELSLLVAGIDEISTYNHNLTRLRGDYRLDAIGNDDLYETLAEGSIAGEGVAAFNLNTKQEGALARIVAVHGFTELTPQHNMAQQAKDFITKSGLQPTDIDVVVSGENGDRRLTPYYQLLEKELSHAIWVRYKHLCGEYPTASAFGLWVALQLQSNPIPTHLIKHQTTSNTSPKNVLIYNTYRGEQHGFILIQLA